VAGRFGGRPAREERRIAKEELRTMTRSAASQE
jgi:hypothetical protein